MECVYKLYVKIFSNRNHSNMIDIIVKSNAPVMLNGGFTADLRKVWIEFDKNINGEISCKVLFSEETYSALGSGKSDFLSSRTFSTKKMIY